MMGGTLEDGVMQKAIPDPRFFPNEAIRYRKKTLQYERYHHPEVRRKDVHSNNARMVNAQL
jgi:hypothetical protein